MREVRKSKITTLFYGVIYLVFFLMMFVISSEFKQSYESLLLEVKELEEYKQILTAKRDSLLEQLKEKNNDIALYKKEIGDLQAENEQLRTIRAKLTAYSPLDNADGNQSVGNPSRTSTGRKVGRNIAAADPKKLPYGTKLEIPNYGIVEIGDTGGALRSDNKNIRIDLFHRTYKEAMKFGVKNMEVRILEWGEVN